MNFDTLAPHYRWMECLLAGGKLQRCRTTFLADVQHAQNVLLLGEGNGRFLTAFAGVNRFAQITVVDSSENMLRQAQRHAVRSDARVGRIQFLHADVLAWSPPPESFDLIVTNFFFDCFRSEQLTELVPRLASAAGTNAQWIVSDFHVPAHGVARWRARGIIAAMYCFFRVATRLPARRLTSVEPLLRASRFQLRQRQFTEWGLLHADLWQRAE
jgi:ubiquinone/menaquinone biosynthesis C-methylase UbiE